MSYWVRVLTGPDEGQTVRLKEGLTSFEKDESLNEEDYFHVYVLRSRVFIRPSASEVARLLDVKTNAFIDPLAKWTEIEGEAVLMLGKTLMLIESRSPNVK